MDSIRLQVIDSPVSSISAPAVLSALFKPMTLNMRRFRPIALVEGRRTQEGMKKRQVSLNSYPCGTIVLEVTTQELPDVVPVAVVPEPEKELAAA